MRKIIFMILSVILLIGSMSCQLKTTYTKGLSDREETLERLLRIQPTPKIQNALERKMIAWRASLFDDVDKIGYVYLMASTGNIVGYYIVSGKMASLQSYLVPQEEPLRYNTASGWNVAGVAQSADIDGTYGENMPGVFFKTTDGGYVEIPNMGGITPIYSDRPLPFNVPQLSVIMEVK